MGTTTSQNHSVASSLVWTPIPCITWLVPFIGHMGITTSNGAIFDFAAPYNVTRNKMAFGSPTKYFTFIPSFMANDIYKKYHINCKISPSHADLIWDYSIFEASREYNNYHVHNLFMDNCHSHVALCLNTFQKYIILYSQGLVDINNTLNTFNLNQDFGSSLVQIKTTNESLPKQMIFNTWNIPKLAFIMFFCGHYMSLKGFIISWLPFICIFLIISLLIVFVH